MAFATFVGDGFLTCNPFAAAYKEPTLLDIAALGVFYDIAVPKGRTKTVTVSYKGL